MRRRPSGGLLWPEDSHEVFHGQKTVMKFSMAKRPSRGLLWLQYHKRVQVQENVKWCSMARKPSVDILWLEDSQKVFYGQETFRSCSMARKSSGKKIPPASFFQKPVRRYSMYRIPSGGHLFLEDRLEVFYVQKTVFYEKKKTVRRSSMYKRPPRGHLSRDLLYQEGRQQIFYEQKTVRRPSMAKPLTEDLLRLEIVRRYFMYIIP